MRPAIRRIRQALVVVVITGLVYFVMSWGLHFYWNYQWEKYYVRGPLSLASVLNLAWESANLSKLSNFAALRQYDRYLYHHWIRRWNQMEGHVYRKDPPRIEGPDHCFALIPGARAKFFEAVVRINRDGYRGPEIDRPQKRIRVLAVGGSTTWGATTARGDKPWPEVLEDLLGPKKFEVINAGVPGHTIVYNERLLAKHLALKPDLIILYHGFNDFYLLVRRYKKRPVSAVEYYYRRYLSRAKRAGVPVVLVSFPLAFDKDSPPKLKALYGPWLGKWFRMTLGERLRQMERLSREQCLRRADSDPGRCRVSLDLSAGLGWPLQPIYRRALEHESPITLAEFEGVIRTHNLITRRLAAEYGETYIDAARVMFGRWRWFIDFCHYTQEGRRILAKLIYSRLEPWLKKLAARRPAAPARP